MRLRALGPRERGPKSLGHIVLEPMGREPMDLALRVRWFTLMGPMELRPT